jgi:hypothetical protein
MFFFLRELSADQSQESSQDPFGQQPDYEVIIAKRSVMKCKDSDPFLRRACGARTGGRCGEYVLTDLGNSAQ